MKNLWDSKQSFQFKENIPQMRVYSSRLLGQSHDLVLHGGGNTSVKFKGENFFGEEEEILLLKGSGVNLANIEEKDFTSLRLKQLVKLVKLENISDTELSRQQRLAMTNPDSPRPSVEALLHAIIPFDWVDHTHADAVVTITNTPLGHEIISDIFGESIVIIPYVKPGFKLARKVLEVTKGIDWEKFEGMVLLNHGIFTFGKNAKESYERMIKYVTKAEKFLKKNVSPKVINTKKSYVKKNLSNKKLMENKTLLNLAKIRRKVSKIAGTPMVARLNIGDDAQIFSNLWNIKEIVTRGPITSDHLIHTKPFPVVLNPENLEESLEEFSLKYEEYFRRQTKVLSSEEIPTQLDSAPRWAVWPDKGTVSFGKNLISLVIVNDISEHTLKAIQQAENLVFKGLSGRWSPVSEKHLFEAEYWELQQKKLESSIKLHGNKKGISEFEGKIAIVTGAASGIGLASALELFEQGAVVVGLDYNPKILKMFCDSGIFGIRCDIRNQNEVKCAVAKTIKCFGGLDILVLNAGTFPAGNEIEEMDDKTWAESLAVNLTAPQQLLKVCVPFLKEGLDPAIVFMASRNVPAPGAGAAAYSVPKAGQTQLARIAALELGKFGIRVNILHPDCVYDTDLWTKEALETSAKRYGLTVEEYKSRNILKKDVKTKEVAKMVCVMAGSVFFKTTGAQISIDGGNERVI